MHHKGSRWRPARPGPSGTVRWFWAVRQRARKKRVNDLDQQTPLLSKGNRVSVLGGGRHAPACPPAHAKQRQRNSLFPCIADPGRQSFQSSTRRVRLHSPPAAWLNEARPPPHTQGQQEAHEHPTTIIMLRGAARPSLCTRAAEQPRGVGRRAHEDPQMAPRPHPATRDTQGRAQQTARGAEAGRSRAPARRAAQHERGVTGRDTLFSPGAAA